MTLATPFSPGHPSAHPNAHPKAHVHRRARRHGQPGRRARGIGLMEVLVSILVVSIGLLGAAALQASALRNNQGNAERTQATLLAQAMFDAMRANDTAAAAGSYNLAAWTCAAPAAASLATRDQARWITDLQTQINPSACGEIACVARDCTVGVRWDDSRATGGSNAQVFRLRGLL